MSKKKTSTPKEIPLHEVVLQILFDANKERSTELTVEDVYSKINDELINESNIFDVLKWLVVQEQVECRSGKFYTLDRFELIDRRAKYAAENGVELNLVSEENPLHEVILTLMYESSTEEPVKLSIDEVFWMISDPKVHKSLVGDVLKWLLNKGRVEYLGGKYALDSIEFNDQLVKSEKQLPKKKIEEKPKVKKKEAEKKPKIVIPSSEEEAKIEPAKPKKAAKSTDKAEKPQKTVSSPVEKEAKVEQKEKVEKTLPPPIEKRVPEEIKPAPVQDSTPDIVKTANSKWRMPTLVASIICVVYCFYLIFALNGSVSADQESSNSVQQEIVSLSAELNKLSDSESLSQKNIKELKDKVRSLEDLTEIDSNNTQNDRSSSLLFRLIIALCLTFILIIFLFFDLKRGSYSKKV